MCVYIVHHVISVNSHSTQNIMLSQVILNYKLTYHKCNTNVHDIKFIYSRGVVERGMSPVTLVDQWLISQTCQSLTEGCCLLLRTECSTRDWCKDSRFMSVCSCSGLINAKCVVAQTLGLFMMARQVTANLHVQSSRGWLRTNCSADVMTR